MTVDVAASIARIKALQDRDGRVRWIDGGLWDSWAQAECAAAFAAAGEIGAAVRALDHLAETQAEDGSWECDMGCAAAMDADNRRLIASGAPQVVDINFCGWPAFGVAALTRADPALDIAKRYAGMVERATAFVLAHQRADGAFAWRALGAGEPLDSAPALMSGSAALFVSLGAAAEVLDAAGRPSDHLAAPLRRLQAALRSAPASIWEDKARYAMDWYYPVLAGALTPTAANARLTLGWERFVDETWGCRCVDDQPWATAAETAELAIACVRLGRDRAAKDLLDAVARMDTANGPWMGRQFAENIFWPEERPSWTAAAAVLAEVAVRRRSPVAQLFRPAPASAEAVTQRA